VTRTRIVIALALPLLLAATAAAEGVEQPVVSHYSLRLQLFPKEHRLEARAWMTVENATSETQAEVPFLLYRLLEVQGVEDSQGDLDFSQEVVKDADNPTLQVNWLRVQLRHPLPPGERARVLVRYQGGIFGYPEVWAYVQDTIAEEYSLLRDDTFSYPILARPSRQSRFARSNTNFTYDLQVTVPAEYVVATGGKLVDTRSEHDLATFVFESRVPTWRLDIAAAKFKWLSSGNLAVYVLPEHEKGGRRVLSEMKKVVDFYSQHFGELEGNLGYTAIEIPAGWGSQAADLYFLQTAAAFTDPSRIGEMYHEVAHSWNATAKAEVQRCRWFDEAFAAYFQGLAIREFQGQEAFFQYMEAKRKTFVRQMDADQRNFGTPIADYGKYEMGGLSYSKGAWSLYVLHELLGDDLFRQFARRLRTDFSETGADFRDVQRLAEELAGRKLEGYFQEWFYGAESSRLLVDGTPIQQIVNRYRQPPY
jgi:hypothetical protein